MFSKLLENTVENREIARLFPQYFKMTYPFPKQALVFMYLQDKSIENTVGKGEIARNKQFLLFPQCFLAILENFPSFSSNLKLSSANSFNMEESKICCLGKGYTADT